MAKRYTLMLETIVKMSSKEAKKEGPHKVLFLREVIVTLSTDITGRIAELVRACDRKRLIQRATQQL